MFDLITPASYWILTILWLVILWLYLYKLRQSKAAGGTIAVLLTILAIDAFRTVFESIYFGFYFNSLFGLFPRGIYDVLTQPELIIIPKLINVVAGFLVLFLLIRRWVPRELREREEWVESLQEAKRFAEEKKDEFEQQYLKFEAIFNGIPDAVIFADTDRRIISTNRGLEKMFGYTVDELAGKKTAVIYESEDEYERQGRIRFNLSAEENAFPYEVNYRRKDGQIFVGETLATTIIGTKGEVLGFVGVIRDATERNEMEAALRQSQKMDALGNLAGGIAHDVNNMLLPIIVLSEKTMRNLPEEGQDRTRLEKVVEAGNKAKDLIASILAFSHRLDPDVKMEEVNIADVIRGTLDLLRSTLPSTISVIDDLNPTTGKVLCDTAQISTVLLNLASNSVDALEGHIGELTVSVVPAEVNQQLASRVSQLKQGQYAKFTVSDTGTGMDADTISKLFEPYFTTKEVGEGTGLGLSMVHGIVTKHGGAVDVRSEIGKGTTFDIYLPIA